MAALILWFPRGCWLLRGSGSIRICGCSTVLFLSLVVASSGPWFSSTLWMLLGHGSLLKLGCSNCMVPSADLGAHPGWFSCRSWLLWAAVSHRVLWLLRKFGSFHRHGCSCDRVLLCGMAAYIKCFYPCEWLLLLVGSLAIYGCSANLVLSISMAAPAFWFAQNRWLWYAG